MKLCVVVPSFYPAVEFGGPIATSLHAARWLARAGTEVFVCTTDAGLRRRVDVRIDRPVELEPRLLVRYYRSNVNDRLSIPLLRGVRGHIRRADVVHVRSIFSATTPAALLASRRLGKPTLLSPHGMLGRWGLEQRRPWMKALWLRGLIRPFARGVEWQATSEQEARDIARAFPGARVHTIPNGVELEEFTAPRREPPPEFAERFLGTRTGVTPHTKIVVSLGRLHRVKGFDLLIDAFREIHARLPDSLLVIAGPDGGEGRALAARARASPAGERVHFVGALEGRDKIEFLAGGDVFVLPSRHESFGVAYVEALAAGTPVVASVHTPWAEVDSRGCGATVECEPAAIAAATLEILSGDPRAMGQRGSDWVRECFDWRVVAGRLQRLFEEMLAGR